MLGDSFRPYNLEQTDTKFKYSLELGEGLRAGTVSRVSERSYTIQNKLRTNCFTDVPKTRFWIEWSQILIWFHRITKVCALQLCHPIALPLSRSLSLRRGGMLLHCVFFASAVAYKDIWVSIGYVQKHVVARALQAFAPARAPRISSASVIHPPFQQKMTSHDMCLSKRRTNCVPQKSSCRIHCPFVSIVKTDLDQTGYTIDFWWIF